MINGLKKPWWETTDITRAVSSRGSVDQIAVFSLLSVALKNDLCVYDHGNDGNLLIKPKEFIEQIEKLGGRCVSSSLEKLESINTETLEYTFVWDDGILTIQLDEDWIFLKASSLDKQLVEQIREISQKNITQKTQGRAYVFVSGENGPELRQISGKAGVELERDNYTPSVVDAFDHIVKDLQSTNPCGRLVIADGDPGTGKTFLVRGITNAVVGVTFILVPPTMIADMMSPQFIPVLMDHHNNKQPIVFILEDADSCLVERGSDNMTSISSLLNLGAGIFGDLFDIRIIATTNAKKIDMDPAITRKGRCCRYIEVGGLPKEQAEQVFKRLVKDKTKSLTGNQKFYTLADVYNAARDEGLEDEKGRKEVGIGFKNV